MIQINVIPIPSMLEDICFLWNKLMKQQCIQVLDLLTVNEGAIEPLNVIVFGEGEEDLVTNDWERQ